MAKTLIKTLTASGSASLDFVDGTSGVVMDNTYPVYEFIFVNMHPASSSAGEGWMFQVNADGESDFDETITSTVFRAYHTEDDGTTELAYGTAQDQAQGAGYQRLTHYTSSANDGSVSGILTLYDPSSGTYVKHFMATSQDMHGDPVATNSWHVAGYINTTTAIDEISFKFDTDNIETGTIYMYGVS
jgi:hypothetical protein